MLNFVPSPSKKKKGKSSEVLYDSDNEDDLLEDYDESTKHSISQLDDKEIPFELIQVKFRFSSINR